MLRRRKFIVEGDRAPQRLGRGRIVLRAEVNEPELEMRRSQSGIELHRAFKATPSGFAALQPQIRSTEVQVRRGRQRRECHRFFEPRQPRGVPVAAARGQAHHMMRGGKPWRERHRMRQRLACALVVAGMKTRDPQFQIRRRPGRIEGDGALEITDGGGIAVLGADHEAEFVLRRRPVRLEGRGLFQEQARFAVSPSVLEHAPEQMRGERPVRPERAGAAQKFFGFGASSTVDEVRADRHLHLRVRRAFVGRALQFVPRVGLAAFELEDARFANSLQLPAVRQAFDQPRSGLTGYGAERRLKRRHIDRGIAERLDHVTDIRADGARKHESHARRRPRQQASLVRLGQRQRTKRLDHVPVEYVVAEEDARGRSEWCDRVEVAPELTVRVEAVEQDEVERGAAEFAADDARHIARRQRLNDADVETLLGGDLSGEIGANQIGFAFEPGIERNDDRRGVQETERNRTPAERVADDQRARRASAGGEERLEELNLLKREAGAHGDGGAAFGDEARERRIGVAEVERIQPGANEVPVPLVRIEELNQHACHLPTLRRCRPTDTRVGEPAALSLVRERDCVHFYDAGHLRGPHCLESAASQRRSKPAATTHVAHPGYGTIPAKAVSV